MGPPVKTMHWGLKNKEDMRIGQCKKHVSPEPFKGNKRKLRKTRKLGKMEYSFLIHFLDFLPEFLNYLDSTSCHFSMSHFINHSKRVK